jgi:hypothetical protein
MLLPLGHRWKSNWPALRLMASPLRVAQTGRANSVITEVPVSSVLSRNDPVTPVTHPTTPRDVIPITAAARERGCNAWLEGKVAFRRNGMSDSPPKATEKLQCPICEGRGEIERDELLARLSEKDLGRKVQTYLSDFVDAARKEELKGVSSEDKRMWNLTHFSWRRSPKD